MSLRQRQIRARPCSRCATGLSLRSATRVRELGGTVLSETTDASGGNASCLDDQGVPFELWQPAPGY